MGWIDDLLGIEVQDDGVDVGQRKRLNFIGADVSEDIANDRIDVVIGGIGDWKESARLCPVAALPAYTRTVNDILADANGALPNLDGVAPQVDDVVLLVAAATASDIDNGLWRITSLGSAGSKWAMTRESTSNETGELTPQTTVRVEAGTVNASRVFHVETTGVITLNTTPISIVDSVTTTPLVTATVRGVVSPFTATANLVLCSDGATAGGVWRAFLNIGTAPPAAGDVRLSHGTTFRGLDVAGVGEAQLIDWGSTSADHLTLGSNDADLDGVDVVAGAAGEYGVRIGATTNLLIAAGAVSYPGNPTHNTGTGAFTVGGALTKNHATDQFAASVAAPVVGHEDDTTVGGVRPNITIRAQSSTVAASTGASVVLRPGAGVAANGLVNILDSSGVSACYFDATYSYIVKSLSNDTFAAAVSSPKYWQLADATASVTCDDLTIVAQAASNAAGGASAARSGCTVIAAPTATGHADNYDGNVALISAPAANLSTLGAEKCCFIGKAVAAPTLAPTNGHILYVDPTTENLLVLGEDNTLTTLALK